MKIRAGSEWPWPSVANARPRLGTEAAVALLTLIPYVVGCSTGGDSATATPVEAGAAREVECPAAPGSGQPNLTVGADGKLYLSWIEPAGDAGSALRFAVRQGEAWSMPRTIATGRDWFVNWADFPTMAALADGTLAANWLAKSGASTYAYEVWLAASRDGGESWSEPVRAHADGTQTEHGFVSLVPLEDRFAVFWLDGRETVGGGGEAGHGGGGSMTLRHGFLGRDGRMLSEALLDERVCDCCQTDALRLDDGALLIAYRDRSEDEIRDIFAARHDAAGWSEPRAVHDDNWRIPGCPVNGPALAAAGERVACAWFTTLDGRGHVRVAFSDDGGRTFHDPVGVDEGNPSGRVDVTLLDDGSALVSWLELGEPATIRVRRVSPSGDLGASQAAAVTQRSRSSGFPRLARHDGRVFLAWTDAGDPSRVRTAVLD